MSASRYRCPTQQRLGPVKAQRLDADLNLARTGPGNIDILDAQNLGTTMLMKANNTCHRPNSKTIELNEL